jgi:hypothetical protein
MAKRAVDLSVEELAALGAKAARMAAQKAQNAGLSITGVVSTSKNGQSTESLARLHPSGTVTLAGKGGRASSRPSRTSNRRRNKAAG